MRDEKLDIFRGVAMIWVIFIHCLFWMGFYALSPNISIVSSLFLIEMPLFFFIAGASNGMSRKKGILKFYLSRFQRILIPYWIYGIVCVCFICILSFPDSFKQFFTLLYSWLVIPVNLPITPVPYLTWALWFIPVYLLIMLVFPILRFVYDKYTTLSIRIIPLFLFFGATLVLDFFQGEKIMYYAKMLTFYGFWIYLGLFYTSLFKKVKVTPALLVVLCSIIATIMLAVFLHKSLNMQHNKFPPKFIFLTYSLGALSILYIFSDFIVAAIKFLTKNRMLKWIFKQYADHSLVVFLFHPFVFLFLNWVKPSFAGLHPLLTFIIFMLIAIPASALLGKLFSWSEKIKIIKV